MPNRRIRDVANVKFVKLPYRKVETMSKQNYLGRLTFLVEQWVRRGWGYPFIAAFLVILLVSAVIVAAGAPYQAEGIANLGYFSLVVGVVLELIYFARKRGNTVTVSSNASTNSNILKEESHEAGNE